MSPLRLGLPEGRAVSLSFSWEVCAPFIAEVYFAQGGGPEFQESEIAGVAVGLPGPLLFNTKPCLSEI